MSKKEIFILVLKVVSYLITLLLGAFGYSVTA